MTIDARDDFARPEAATVELFRDLPVATVSDIVGPGHTMAARMRPLRTGARLLGTALTLRLPPGDNLGMHLAILLSRPGDVIVADQAGTQDGAPVGEIVATVAQTKGVAGIVLDGAIRDLARLRDMPMPVFAIGVFAQQCTKDGPASVGLPITCAGVPVAPGDIVLGDDDGVVIVPAARAVEVATGTRRKMQQEARRLASIAAGELYPEWLAELLARKGWRAP
jgi:regulator of RNase E activity RraA